MSNKQARGGKLTLVNLIAVMDTGSVVHLDTAKVLIVDAKTKKPIFVPKEIK